MKIGTAFPSNFLKAEDLRGRAVKVVIDSVTEEKIGEDRKPVLHFAGKDKGLVLNKTNAARITEALGSDETNDWEGATITLYATKVEYQGKRVDAIRVDDRPGSSTPGRGRAVASPDPITEEDVPF